MCCNRRPVALDHPPVDATVVVATDIPRRDPIELRPVRVRADRIDPGIPLAARLEKRRGRNVRLLLGAGMKLLVEFLQRLQKAGLLRERKADRSRTPRPRRRRLVDQAALCLGNVSPGIAIGRMQPTAAEIDWKCRISAHRPRASAEPRPGLHDETIDMRVHEPPACGDTSRAAAHNYDLGIAVGHALFRGDLDRDVRFDRPTDRAVPTMPVHAVSMPILSPRSKGQQRLFAFTKSTPTRALFTAGPRKPVRLETLPNGAATPPHSQICGLDCQRILGARVAVEFGVEAANRFDLGGQGLVTQKSALMRERNPELVGASIASAGAQDWPTRPIRLVVGASAGGGTDISARL